MACFYSIAISPRHRAFSNTLMMMTSNLQLPSKPQVIDSLMSLFRGFTCISKFTFSEQTLYFYPSPIHLFSQFSKLFKKHHLFSSCSGQKVVFMIKPSHAHVQPTSKSSVSCTSKTYLKYDHYFSPLPHPP